MVCGGPFVPPCRRGVASALVGLVGSVVWDAGRGYVVGWWSAGPVRCVLARWVCVAGVWVCRSGWWVRRVSAGLPSLGACALVLCPLGFLPPRAVPGSVVWGVVVPSGVLGPLPFCPSASLSFSVLGASAGSPSPSGARAVASVWLPLL